MKEQIAQILKTTVEKLPSRVGGLNLGETCSRCGGSGQYSFNPIDGTRCFKCGGSGQLMPTTKKGLNELLRNAEKCATNGTLDAYLEKLRKDAQAKKAQDTALSAWKAASKFVYGMYTWRDFVGAEEGSELHQRSESNKKIAEEYESLVKLVRSKATTETILAQLEIVLSAAKAEAEKWQR